MKKHTFITVTLFASLSLLFTACPYWSDYRLNADKQKIDEGITGQWAYYDEWIDADEFYTITKEDDYTYKILYSMYGYGQQEDTEESTAYLVNYKGSKLLEWNSGNRYQYAKYTASETTLSLYFFDEKVFMKNDTLIKFNSASEFNKYAADKFTNGNIYGDEVILYKE